MPDDVTGEPGRPKMVWEELRDRELAAKEVEKERILRAARPHETPTPELREEALYGPHGDYCRAVEGKSEAHTSAVLAHLLVLYGCWCGPRAFIDRGFAHQGPNVSAVIVGASAHSMKGTAKNVAILPYRQAEAIDQVTPPPAALPVPVGMQSAEGFASGEALIDRLADPDIPDPRCVVIETEFAAMVKRMTREGSTLGQVTRQMFDQTKLETRSRKHGHKVAADDAYWVGVMGHVTSGELRATLDASSVYGGTVNRFLWFHVPASTIVLAKEPPLPPAAVRAYVAALELDVGMPRYVGPIEMTTDADDLWLEYSKELKGDDPRGLVGAVTGRNRAQVLRLAVNYTMSVGAPIIGVRELKAAKAVWDYSRQSSWIIFGYQTGVAEVDSLVRFMQDEDQRGQATPTELKVEFGNHYRSRVERAELMGLVERVKLPSPGPGPKPVIYRLVGW